MIKLNIIGVTSVSDLYPNVKYKISLISSLQDIATIITIHNLENSGHFNALKNRNPINKIASVFNYLWGTVAVFINSLSTKAPNIYICYPGVFLALLYSLVPKSRRPVIFYDAFISLYDTAVNDRTLYDQNSLIAKFLYWAESKAFKVSDRIITDTEDNSTFYARLFNQPAEKFEAIHLCIPPLEHQPVKSAKKESFNCLFIGSLVPLHGINFILEAMSLLHEHENIKFKIIGDGQEAHIIEKYRAKNPFVQLTWDRGFYPTSYLASEINKADLCLGVFGDTEKAGRVIPYKIYYYAALEKPFISRMTPSFERINNELENPLTLISGKNPQELSLAILAISNNNELSKQQELASKEFYKKHLGEDAIKRKLSKLFFAHGQSHSL